MNSVNVKYNVVKIQNTEQLENLKSIWNKFSNSNDNICLTYEWISCWLKCFRNNNDLLNITLFEQQQEPIAIAPLIIKKDHLLFFPVSKVEFISMAEYPDSPTNICAELDFITKSKNSSIISDILKELLNDKWNYIRLHPISKTSPTILELKKAAEELKLIFIEREAFNALIVDTKITWNEFNKTLSKRFRKQLRYFQNKFKEIGNLEVVLFKSPNEIKENLNKILEIEKKSWKWKKGVSINSISYKNFFKEFPLEVSSNEWIHLWMLKLNDNFIAYDMNICYKDKVINWKGSYDEKYSDFGPGQILLEKELEYYINNGITEFNMLWGKTLAKERWNPKYKSFSEIFIFKNDLYSKLIKTLLINFKLYKIIRVYKNYKNRILRKLNIRSTKSELTRSDQI